MFYKKYLIDLMMQLKKDSNKKINYINDIIDEIEVNIDKNDKNASQHWKNQKEKIDELGTKQNMLVNAFNEQRLIIAKLVEKINGKQTKTTKKKGK